MKTAAELREILSQHSFSRVDAHIHTHLCDGQETMTVANIAKKAGEANLTLIVLTPHFHKQVSDESAVLYHDSDEEILLRLREEIDDYHQKGGKLQILLSTEADVLGTDGTTALNISKHAEDALDLITPTVNYHPLLPLKAVEVTYGRCIEEIHSSGTYSSFAQKIGGVEKVLETLYETETNAILRSPYPGFLGHFFAAHSYAVGMYNWFGASPEHIGIMKQGAEKILSACVKTGMMIDVTGIHCGKLSHEEKSKADGFFFDFQRWFLNRCCALDILVFSGSDAHGLNEVGDIAYYKRFE